MKVRIASFSWIHDVLLILSLAYMSAYFLVGLNPKKYLLGFVVLVFWGLFLGVDKMTKRIEQDSWYPALPPKKRFQFQVERFSTGLLLTIGLFLFAFSSPEFYKTHTFLFAFITSLSGITLFDLFLTAKDILKEIERKYAVEIHLRLTDDEHKEE